MSLPNGSPILNKSIFKPATVGLVVLLITIVLLNRYLNNDQKSSAGFIVGMWGVGATLVGLGITLLQVSQTANAASAANLAVQKLRRDVSLLDSISEFGQCQQHIEATINDLADSRWREARSGFTAVRATLNLVVAKSAEFPGIDIESIKNHLSFIIASAGEIDLEPNEGFDTSEMRHQLRVISDTLKQAEILMRESFSDRQSATD